MPQNAGRKTHRKAYRAGRKQKGIKGKDGKGKARSDRESDLEAIEK
jgi:hypothetical protein